MSVPWVWTAVTIMLTVTTQWAGIRVAVVEVTEVEDLPAKVC